MHRSHAIFLTLAYNLLLRDDGIGIRLNVVFIAVISY